MFSIDRYSGKVLLIKPLDYETQQEYIIKIAASDTTHVAHTTLTIRVTDVNDNPPVFTQNFYHTTLPGIKYFVIFLQQKVLLIYIFNYRSSLEQFH